MTARPADWSVFGLPSDPIPGDPVAAGISADTFQRNAEAVARARDNLQRLDTSSNETVALDKVKEQIRKVAADLEKVQSRVEGAAQALKDYSPKLEGAQSESAAALEEALQARASQRSHKNQVATLRDRVKTTADPFEAQTLADEVRREQTAVKSAASSLTAAQTRLANAINARNEAASDAMTHLDKVAAGSQIREGVLDKIVHTVTKLVAKVVEFVKDIIENLDLIAMLLTVVGLVLSFTPLAPIGILMMSVGTALGKLATLISTVKMIISLTGSVIGVLNGTLPPEQLFLMLVGVAIGIVVGIVFGKLAGRLGKSVTKRGALYRRMPESLRTNLEYKGERILNPIVGPAKVGKQTAMQKLFSIPSWNDKAKVNSHLNLSATLRDLAGDSFNSGGTEIVKHAVHKSGMSEDGLDAGLTAGGYFK